MGAWPVAIPTAVGGTNQFSAKVAPRGQGTSKPTSPASGKVRQPHAPPGPRSARPLFYKKKALHVSRWATTGHLSSVATDLALRLADKQEPNQAQERQSPSSAESQPVPDQELRHHLELGTRPGF